MGYRVKPSTMTKGYHLGNDINTMVESSVVGGGRKKVGKGVCTLVVR